MRVKALETILVLVLALLVWYYADRNGYVLVAAMVLAGIGVFIPALAKQIHVLWVKLGEGLGFISSKIILTIVFFFFLVPIAWVAARFRKPVMKIKSNERSFFKNRHFTYTKKSMEDMW